MCPHFDSLKLTSKSNSSLKWMPAAAPLVTGEGRLTLAEERWIKLNKLHSMDGQSNTIKVHCIHLIIVSRTGSDVFSPFSLMATSSFRISSAAFCSSVLRVSLDMELGGAGDGVGRSFDCEVEEDGVLSCLGSTGGLVSNLWEQNGISTFFSIGSAGTHLCSGCFLSCFSDLNIFWASSNVLGVSFITRRFFIAFCNASLEWSGLSCWFLSISTKVGCQFSAFNVLWMSVFKCVLKV